MKWHVWSLALVPSALLAPLVFAGPTETQGLKRVAGGDASADPGAAAPRGERDGASDRGSSTFDAAAWKARLSAGDLDARERAFDELADVVRRDGSARRAVEDWSRDTASGELAWTSRLLLREARTSGIARGRAGFAPGAGFEDLRARLDELERGFGGLDSMFEDMQRDFDRAFGGAQGFGPGAGAAPAPQGGGLRRQAQSYSMQMGPDGVKVEVQEDVDGKQETKTYTANSLDELYEAHPELRDRMGLRLRSGPFSNRAFRFGPNGASPFGDDSDPWSGRGGQLWPAPDTDGRVPTDRLGVMVDENAKIDRAAWKIDDGVGLVVRSVQDGTIAKKIGIEPGDVIVDVNGRAIHGVADVRSVLDTRKIDEDVTVTVFDAQGKRRTLTWRATPANEKDRSF